MRANLKQGIGPPRVMALRLLGSLTVVALIPACSSVPGSTPDAGAGGTLPLRLGFMGAGVVADGGVSSLFMPSHLGAFNQRSDALFARQTLLKWCTLEPRSPEAIASAATGCAPNETAANDASGRLHCLAWGVKGPTRAYRAAPRSGATVRSLDDIVTAMRAGGAEPALVIHPSSAWGEDRDLTVPAKSCSCDRVAPTPENECPPEAPITHGALGVDVPCGVKLGREADFSFFIEQLVSHFNLAQVQIGNEVDNQNGGQWKGSAVDYCRTLRAAAEGARAARSDVMVIASGWLDFDFVDAGGGIPRQAITRHVFDHCPDSFDANDLHLFVNMRDHADRYERALAGLAQVMLERGLSKKLVVHESGTGFLIHYPDFGALAANADALSADTASCVASGVSLDDLIDPSNASCPSLRAAAALVPFRIMYAFLRRHAPDQTGLEATTLGDYERQQALEVPQVYMLARWHGAEELFTTYRTGVYGRRFADPLCLELNPIFDLIGLADTAFVRAMPDPAAGPGCARGASYRGERPTYWTYLQTMDLLMRSVTIDRVSDDPVVYRLTDRRGRPSAVAWSRGPTTFSMTWDGPSARVTPMDGTVVPLTTTVSAVGGTVTLSLDETPRLIEE